MGRHGGHPSKVGRSGSCHTKVTLNFLTVRRTLRQAGNTYEISQICPQNFHSPPVSWSQCDRLGADVDQRRGRDVSVSYLLQVV